MSDPPPAPKPKPGSLRDRIAAFEKQGSSAAPAPAPAHPVPRPKPGGVSWKPKPPSPPSSPKGSSEQAGAEKHGGITGGIAGGMSAADAKESITKGGSLKERMAALQGRGAFGAPAPAPPPKPAADKPKWKPPPVVAQPVAEVASEVTTNEPKADEETSKDPVGSPPRTHETPHADQDPSPEGGDDAEPEPVAEEEERQRRAAIAARMARLGGARVGMAPPIFGKKPVPVPNKVETPKEEVKPVELEPEHADQKLDEVVKGVESSTAESEDVGSPDPSAEQVDSTPAAQRKDSDILSIRSVEVSGRPVPSRTSTSNSLSAEPGATGRSPPSPMPVPAVPRRTAPPRKRAAKSPSPAPTPSVLDDDAAPVLEGSVNQEAAAAVVPADDGDSQGAAKEDAPQADSTSSSRHVSRNVVNEPAADEISHKEDPVDEGTEGVALHEEDRIEGSERPISDVQEISEEPHTHDLAEDGHDHVVPAHTSGEDATELEPVEHHPNVPEDEEEDDAARRKRIAERIAKSGGLNPLGGPFPPRRSSSTASMESQPPAGRKDSSSEIAVPTIVETPPVEDIQAPPSRRASTLSAKAPQAVEEELPVAHESDEEDEEAPAHASESEEEESPSTLISQISREEGAEVEDEVAGHGVANSKQEDNDNQPPLVLREAASENTEASAPAPPHRRSMPPPPRHQPSLPVSRSNLQPAPEANGPGRSQFVYGPEQVVEPKQEDLDVEEAQDAPYPPPRAPARQASRKMSAGLESPPPPAQQASRKDSVGSESPLPPPRAPVRQASRKDSVGPESPPPPPRAPARQASRRESVVPESPPPPRTPARQASRGDSAGPESPPPPRRRSMPPAPVTRVASPQVVAPAPPARREIPAAPISSYEIDEEHDEISSVPDEDIGYRNDEQLRSRATPSLPSVRTSNLRVDEEVLDESEGDPIDPMFHSPARSPIVPASPITASAPPPVELDEDEEQARRRTIAQRMAKLGGIQFGAPPPIRRTVPVPSAADTESTSDPAPVAYEGGDEEVETEASEQARRQRIAGKLAGMGGMRLGMLPPSLQQSPRATALPQPEYEETSPPPPPPRRSSRQMSAPMAPQEYTQADSKSPSEPDDIVQVEAEESEVDDADYEEVREDEPPPVPTRTERRSSIPVIPSVPITRRSGSEAVVGSRPPLSSITSNPDFVMVEEPESSDPETLEAEEAPPPPPPRTVRSPPSRSAPPPPPPPNERAESQWVLPSIPTSALELENSTDLSASMWSEDSTHYPSQGPPSLPSAGPAGDVSRTAVPANMSPDDLIGVWGQVGVMVAEAAALLHDKAKKTVVGDGSYAGFVHAVLAEVPNALIPADAPQSYGYLIYSQTGSAVGRRTSDILPGDVIALYDAKLKGHKGLQSYNQHVGEVEPCVGVITEFETKKSKVKVLQANQHVGHQTVESVSYRLEDLKSGTVKVFRVLRV